MYEKNQVVPHSDVIREELLWMMTNEDEFINAISGSGTDSKEKTVIRFEKWLSVLKDIVGIPVNETRAFSYNYKKQLWDFDSTCALCGQKIHLIEDAEIDHIEHYWRGGKTLPGNARLSHRYCNRARSHSEYVQQETTIRPFLTRKGTKITRIRGAIPQKEYCIPILETLLEKGGKASVRDVFEIIEQKMSERFNQIDLEILSDGYTRRWQKMVAWKKYTMVKEGFLKSDSIRGIWEITEKGRKFLEQQ